MAGTSVTKASLSGFVVPSKRISVDNLDSSSVYTQYGPRKGIATATVPTSMQIETTGTQSADGDVRIRTQSPGNPGNQTSSFVWREGGTGDWVGWDGPQVLTGFEFLERSTTANRWKHPHAVTLADGTVLVVAVRGLRYIVVWARNPSTGVWTDVDVYDAGTALSFSMNPCLCVMPSGRVQVYHWWDTDGTGANCDIRMWYSDDSGATWTSASKRCAGASVDSGSYDIKRIRAAHGNGTTALFFWLALGGSEIQVQLASADSGSTFTEVESRSDTDRGYQDVAFIDGRFLVAWCALASGDYIPYTASIVSAYQPVSEANAAHITTSKKWANQSAGNFSIGELCIARDDDGRIYLVGLDITDRTLILSYSDDGETFADYNTSRIAWLNDTSTYPEHLGATFCRGSLFIASKHVASPASADDSLSVIRTGGYSSQPFPTRDAYQTAIQQSGYDLAWLPFDEPENTGTAWTANGAGTSTLVGTGINLSTSGTARNYETSPTITNEFDVIVEAKVTTGTLTVKVRQSSATPLMYDCNATLTTTAITLVDVNAGTAVGTAALTGTTMTQMRLSVNGASATLWYRQGLSATWIQVATTTTLTSSATNPGDLLQIGCIGASTSDVTIRWMAYNTDTLIGRSSGDIIGRCYNTTPVYVTDGLSIYASNGPTYNGDTWQIQAVYDNPIERLIPTANDNSPRTPWASSTDAANVEFVFDLANGVDALPDCPLMGFAFLNANFPAAELWAKKAAGAYTKLADFDLRTGSALKYTRGGGIVIPDTSGGSDVPTYIMRDSLAGSRFRLDASTVRKIISNSDGVWAASSSAYGPRLTLAGVQGGDPSSGSGGAIWHKDFVGIVPILDTYAYYKIVIPAVTTLEGRFQCRLLIGGCYVWGTDPAWADSVETLYTRGVAETESGARSMRRKAPARRAYEVNFADGVEMTGVFSTSPNYVLGWTSGSAVANQGDAPYSVQGLITELESGALPAVYVRRITTPSTSSTVRSIHGREHVIFGSITNDVLRSDGVMGTGLENEIRRLGTVRIEELT